MVRSSRREADFTSLCAPKLEQLQGLGWTEASNEPINVVWLSDSEQLLVEGEINALKNSA